jgi:hypothetical protein
MKLILRANAGLNITNTRRCWSDSWRFSLCWSRSNVASSNWSWLWNRAFSEGVCFSHLQNPAFGTMDHPVTAFGNIVKGELRVDDIPRDGWRTGSIHA